MAAGLLLTIAFMPVRGQQGAPKIQDSVKVDPATETVIAGALKYLASQQLPDGHWSGDVPNGAPDKWGVAMTSYTLMAFLANGNLPNGGLYAKQVKNGVQYLLDSVQSDGLFRVQDPAHYMYCHGLGTMVLAEVYGETQDPAIRAKLEHLVLLIVHSQNFEGGWRYQPGSKDADISVTVPQMVALCAAKRAGIEVPQVTIDKAVAYIKRCYLGPGKGFSYQVGRPPGDFARASAAIYGLQVSGLYDDPLIQSGSAYVMNLLKQSKRPGWNTEWLTYGTYYAGVAHYLMGGDAWKNYYQVFAQNYLLSNVIRKADMDHWEVDPKSKEARVGSNWSTAVFTTILSLPYGYLPLYQR